MAYVEQILIHKSIFEPNATTYQVLHAIICYVTNYSRSAALETRNVLRLRCKRHLYRFCALPLENLSALFPARSCRLVTMYVNKKICDIADRSLSAFLDSQRDFYYRVMHRVVAHGHDVRDPTTPHPNPIIILLYESINVLIY